MYQLSVEQLHRKFLSKELSATEIASYFLQRIESADPSVGAFLHVMKERVLKKAKELDHKQARGESLGPLAGVPIAVKDIINIRGELSTCASKILSNHRALFDATAIERLEQADALLIGKTNLDEFAMGSSTQTSAYKITRNPWNLQCTPGGSSGGSAAAVAARFAPLALGSDTGGSVRQPAAFTGTVGFKPTYGRVSRYGLIAFASSLDHLSPFGTCVSDIAQILEVIAHHCPKDSTSIRKGAEPYVDELKSSIQGKRIGVPWSFLEGLKGDGLALFENALSHYEKLGVTIVPIELPMAKYAIPIYYTLASAEASTNLARFDGVQYTNRSKTATSLDAVYDESRKEGFGSEVKKRIMLGTFVLSSAYQEAYYNKARKVRTLLIQDFKNAFNNVDIIALPTTPSTAFPIGSIVDDAEMHMQDLYTIPANMAGIPALSVPIGCDTKNLPYGIQLLAPQLEDARALRFGYHLETSLALSQRVPPLFDKAVL